MSKTIFEEKQRFNQWTIWLGIGAVVCFMVYQFINKENMEEFLISILGLGLVVLLILAINLKTRIDEKGIHIKMFPFHLSTVSYRWEELYSAEVTKYSPLGDYGGWGLRISRKGKAFNVRGDIGIKIRTADGKSRMIGTQKSAEAKQVLENYKSKLS